MPLHWWNCPDQRLCGIVECRYLLLLAGCVPSVGRLLSSSYRISTTGKHVIPSLKGCSLAHRNVVTVQHPLAIALFVQVRNHLGWQLHRFLPYVAKTGIVATDFKKTASPSCSLRPHNATFYCSNEVTLTITKDSS